MAAKKTTKPRTCAKPQTTLEVGLDEAVYTATRAFALARGQTLNEYLRDAVASHNYSTEMHLSIRAAAGRPLPGQARKTAS